MHQSPRILLVSLILTLALALDSCGTTRAMNRQFADALEEPLARGQHTGILLVDALSGDTLYSHNAGRYFTPASNTKLFTFFAAIKMLPPQMPALKYGYRGDTLLVAGTGDPSALHPVLNDSTALKFLGRHGNIAMINQNLEDAPWGPGWAWDDYDQYYSAPRSAFPLHGNVLWLGAGADRLIVRPEALRDSLMPRPGGFARAQEHNWFYRLPEAGDTLEIPFYTNPEVERRLWQSVSGKTIAPTALRQGDSLRILPGIPTDSLLKRMMTYSDNFIAEQLMLAVSGALGDTLGFARARDHILTEFLPQLPQAPRWVDGSGLSRYNLFTPESLVYLLSRLYHEVPEERLFALLAQGGQPGTLEDWYADAPQPYVFGKTGSLNNNHNLSGYLRTRSGRTVIFSFMNNNYVAPSASVKDRMQRLLTWVRDHH